MQHGDPPTRDRYWAQVEQVFVSPPALRVIYCEMTSSEEDTPPDPHLLYMEITSARVELSWARQVLCNAFQCLNDVMVEPLSWNYASCNLIEH